MSPDVPHEAAACEHGPDRLLGALKKSASAMRRAGVRFALAGGYAAYARGGAVPTHDVDFAVMEEEVEAAAGALADAGLRIVRPPEGWLVKAYDGNAMVDLIFQFAEEPVTAAMLARAQELRVAATRMPVLDATDLVASWLEVFSEHHADFGATLASVRSLREQVDWPVIHQRAHGSPFAEAFLFLLERLRVAPGPSQGGP